MAPVNHSAHALVGLSHSERGWPWDGRNAAASRQAGDSWQLPGFWGYSPIRLHLGAGPLHAVKMQEAVAPLVTVANNHTR